MDQYSPLSLPLVNLPEILVPPSGPPDTEPIKPLPRRRLSSLGPADMELLEFYFQLNCNVNLGLTSFELLSLIEIPKPHYEQDVKPFVEKSSDSNFPPLQEPTKESDDSREPSSGIENSHSSSSVPTDSQSHVTPDHGTSKTPEFTGPSTDEPLDLQTRPSPLKKTPESSQPPEDKPHDLETPLKNSPLNSDTPSTPKYSLKRYPNGKKEIPTTKDSPSGGSGQNLPDLLSSSPAPVTIPPENQKSLEGVLQSLTQGQKNRIRKVLLTNTMKLASKQKSNPVGIGGKTSAKNVDKCSAMSTCDQPALSSNKEKERQIQTQLPNLSSEFQPLKTSTPKSGKTTLKKFKIPKIVDKSVTPPTSHTQPGNSNLVVSSTTLRKKLLETKAAAMKNPMPKMAGNFTTRVKISLENWISIREILGGRSNLKRLTRILEEYGVTFQKGPAVNASIPFTLQGSSEKQLKEAEYIFETFFAVDSNYGKRRENKILIEDPLFTSTILRCPSKELEQQLFAKVSKFDVRLMQVVEKNSQVYLMVEGSRVNVKMANSRLNNYFTSQDGQKWLAKNKKNP